MHRSGHTVGDRHQRRVVVFDIGGVIVDFSESLNATARLLDMDTERFKRAWLPYDDRVCRGTIDMQQMWEAFARSFGYDGPYVDFLELWTRGFRPIPETHRAIRKLAASYPVSIMSNIAHGAYERILGTTLPDIPYAAVVRSCDIGIIKPESGIYEHMERMLGASPQDIVYVDDRDVCVKAAGKRGWHTVLFQTERPEVSLTELSRLVSG